MVLSVFPDKPEKFNIDYALQIGAAVLLNKPLLVLVTPGIELPPKLRVVADEIIEASLDDVDTSAPELGARVKAFAKRHVAEDCPDCFGKGLENQDERPGILLGPQGERPCPTCGGTGKKR